MRFELNSLVCVGDNCEILDTSYFTEHCAQCTQFHCFFCLLEGLAVVFALFMSLLGRRFAGLSRSSVRFGLSSWCGVHDLTCRVRLSSKETSSRPRLAASSALHFPIGHVMLSLFSDSDGT